jgi:hypothetical protein
MKRSIFARRRAERFAQLLDEANGGRRHHARTRADDELTSLVTVGRQLGAGPASADLDLDPDFRAGLRAMLVATAEREGIGATAEQPVPAGRGSTGASRLPILPPVTARRARARGAILIGVAAGAIAVSGISAASENAVPGDALYGMKRSTERAQLALASSDVSRGQLLLDFARTRLTEATVLRDDPAAFATVLADMDEDTREGARLITSSTVQQSDATALDSLDTFVAGQRRAVAELLDGAARTERDRGRRSLGLLDSIEARSDALSRAVSCGADLALRHDSLGPVPQSCPQGR